MQSYRNRNATWLGSPNFTQGRAGHDLSQPSWVVLHTMVGTVQQADARFQQPVQQASATYGVDLFGRLYQWVDEADAAWANGNTGTGGVGDNLDSISIEHEDAGDFNGPRTPALYAASSALVRDICLRYGIPIDRKHVIGHRECTGNPPTACPDALDLDRIVSDAASAPAPAPAVEVEAMVRTFVRPDGTHDTFELLPSADATAGTVTHTHVDPATEAVLDREVQLPGIWETVQDAGVWPPASPTELWMRGTGIDGRLWQANLPLQPGATWVLQGVVA